MLENVDGVFTLVKKRTVSSKRFAQPASFRTAVESRLLNEANATTAPSKTMSKKLAQS